MEGRNSQTDTLQSLLAAKKRAHNNVLQVYNTVNRREFRKHQRTVKCAIDAAKEEWISELANIAEKARKRWQTKMGTYKATTCRTQTNKAHSNVEGECRSYKKSRGS